MVARGFQSAGQLLLKQKSSKCYGWDLKKTHRFYILKPICTTRAVFEASHDM